MKKIELSADEIKVINQHLNGEIEVWRATEKQQELLMGVIDKADALLEELDAYNELEQYEDMSTIQWYYDKYRAQDGEGK